MPDDDVLADATAIRRGSGLLARRLRAERRDSDVSLTGLSILAHLHSRGPLSPGALAELERVQPQSLTRTLADLEDADLVRRQADPVDGRRAVVSIAAAGTELLRADARTRDRWLATALQAELTPAERALLVIAAGLMDRLAVAD